jgi:hypothetical protein
MEGRYPKAIMLTLAACSEPDHLDEWLDWYARIHTPDVTAAGIFVNMIRFMNTASDHEGRQIANLSETDFADPLEALEELKARGAPFVAENRRSEYTRVVEGGGPFVRVGGEFQFIKNAPVRGIYLEAMTLVGDAAVAGFNDWYNDRHIPAMLTPGIFQSAYRYQRVSAAGPTHSFLCIYETDRVDADRALVETRDQAGLPDQFVSSKLAWEMTARRIWPLEGR